MPQLEVHFLVGASFGFLLFLLMYFIDIKKLKKGVSLVYPLLIMVFWFLALVPDFPSITDQFDIANFEKEEIYEHSQVWDIFFFHVSLDQAYGVGQPGPVIPAFYGVMIIYSVVFALYINSFKKNHFT
jgi:hypothetical protein